jgi:cytidylate kinase
MGVVTLTGHLASMGEVGTLVAQSLGYRLVGREIVAEAAKSLGWRAGQADEFDERTGGLGSWLRNLVEHYVEHSAAEPSDLLDPVAAYGMTYADAAGAVGPTSDQYIDALRTVMTAFADADNVVLVGRGGQALFAERPGVTHIRVACPVEERARRIARRDQITEEAALAAVQESDRQRASWHSKYFGIDYRSPYHYHLVVNTGRLSDAFAAQIITEVARQQFSGAAQPHVG